MTGLVNRHTVTPDAEADARTQAHIARLWGDTPGEVVSYDAGAGTVDVQPLYRPLHNGEPVTLPVLDGVPLAFPRTDTGALTFPVGAGARVRLSPYHRDADAYHAGQDYVAASLRVFSLSDMVAYVIGGPPLSDPLGGVRNDRTHLRTDPEGRYGYQGAADGTFAMPGARGDVIALLAEFMELVADDGLAITSGSSAGTGTHGLQNAGQLRAIADKVRGMSAEG